MLFRSNILAEQKCAHPYQSAGYFEALGFLAKHADFQAEVPPQSQPHFEQNYSSLTGTHPVLHRDGYFPIRIQTTYDKWGPELRIYFPDPGRGLDLPSDVEIRSGSTPEVVRINNNGFWWRLIKVGFRLGRNHQIAEIRQRIPRQYQPDFDGGYNS